MSQAARRKIVENSRPEEHRYAGEKWASTLRAVDHFAMHQQLVDLLQHHSIPFRILYNSENLAEMSEIECSDIDEALRGHFQR